MQKSFILTRRSFNTAPVFNMAALPNAGANETTLVPPLVTVMVFKIEERTLLVTADVSLCV